MNSDNTGDRDVARGHVLSRTVILGLGVLALVIALLSPESRGLLLMAGGLLFVTGLFLGSLLRNYKNIAIASLNTILLFLVVEFLSAVVLAAGRSPYIRGMLENMMGRSNRIVDHYLALPYYSQQAWSASYWNEYLQALRKEYYPYVIWRSPSFSGEMLNIDQEGIRKTPGAECLPDSFRIYVFGGSSVWGWGSPDWGTIPAHLQKKLSGLHDGPVCVVNYGENAFVSTQDVIQLMMLLERDDVPDVVIFIDGVNEVLAASQNGKPVVHQNFKQVAALFEEPGHPLASWLKSLNTAVLMKAVLEQLGPASDPRSSDTEIPSDRLATSIVQSYMNNYRIVGALAGAYGFKYYFFLQPFILAGKKPLTEEERAMLTGLSWWFDLNSAVADLFKATYGQIISVSHDHDHLYSLVGVFDGKRDQIWLDTLGHITPVGNEHVADAIIEKMTIK